jgi:hypothetical protein
LQEITRRKDDQQIWHGWTKREVEFITITQFNDMNG